MSNHPKVGSFSAQKSQGCTPAKDSTRETCSRFRSSGTKSVPSSKQPWITLRNFARRLWPASPQWEVRYYGRDLFVIGSKPVLAHVGRYRWRWCAQVARLGFDGTTWGVACWSKVHRVAPMPKITHNESAAKELQ